MYKYIVRPKKAGETSEHGATAKPPEKKPEKRDDSSSSGDSSDEEEEERKAPNQLLMEVGSWQEDVEKDKKEDTWSINKPDFIMTKGHGLQSVMSFGGGSLESKGKEGLVISC